MPLVAADGSELRPDYQDLKEDGQQKQYAVLSPEERALGYVRPVRDSYIHSRCGTLTRMGRAIAETYAREPGFYTGTFCCGCKTHFPVSEFVWAGDNTPVGT